MKNLFLQHYEAIIHRILLILWITHKKKWNIKNSRWQVVGGLTGMSDL